jgi:hypothetical protein
MTSKRTLARRIRGWVPKEPNLTRFQRGAKHKIYVATAIGYGLGLAVFAILLASFYFLGWYGHSGNSLFPDSIIYGVLFGTCWAIGLLVGTRIQKRWSRS